MHQENKNNSLSLKEKWYDNLILLDILIFILPPIGIYGVIRSSKVKSNLKKLLFCTLGIISMLTTLTVILQYV